MQITYLEYIKQNKMNKNDYTYGYYLERILKIMKGTKQYRELKRISNSKKKFFNGGSMEELESFIKENS